MTGAPCCPRCAAFKKEYQKLGDSFLTLATSFKFDSRPSAQGLTRAVEATGSAYKSIGELFAAQVCRPGACSMLALFTMCAYFVTKRFPFN